MTLVRHMHTGIERYIQRHPDRSPKLTMSLGEYAEYYGRSNLDVMGVNPGARQTLSWSDDEVRADPVWVNSSQSECSLAEARQAVSLSFSEGQVSEELSVAHLARRALG